jgi:hypothetical protein
LNSIFYIRAPSFYRSEKGYFGANGLDVTIKEYDFGLKAADALVEGKAIKKLEEIKKVTNLL